MRTQYKSGTSASRVIRAGSWLLLLLLLPLMLLCLHIVIQSARHPERLPTVFGYKALILQPDMPGGERALGILRSVELADLKTQDLVAYKENDVFFVEQVSQIEVRVQQMAGQAEGAVVRQTGLPGVAAGQIEGKLVKSIPKVGSWTVFLQTPTGMLLFVVLPGLLYILMDAFPRTRPFERRLASAEPDLNPVQQI